MDDPRNSQQEGTRNMVLHRDTSSRLLNGVYIARLMLNLKKVIVTRSTKPFSLDEKLQRLKDQPHAAAKQQNWDVLTTELKKFAIKLSKDSLQLIVNDSDSNTVNMVLQQLQAYDANLEAMEPTEKVLSLKRAQKGQTTSKKQQNHLSPAKHGRRTAEQTRSLEVSGKKVEDSFDDYYNQNDALKMALGIR